MISDQEATYVALMSSEDRPEMGSRQPTSDFFALKRGRVNSIGIQVEDAPKICVVMVGLPARGKSLISQKGMSSP